MSSNDPAPPDTAAATAAAAKPAAVAAPKEKAEDEGEYSSIDTFGAYQPSALPPAVVQACNQTATVVNLTEDDDDDDEHDNNKENGGTPLTPLNQLTVPSHTSAACESALLASVAAPPIPNDAADALLEVASNGALSPLQLEGVLLALQRHRRIFQTGERSGFFLGDGAGVGKGRQCATILRNSLVRNHNKRHLWLSVSRELVVDARRDLNDVGVHCDVHDGTQLLDKKQLGLGSKADKGVLFLTYSLLISANRLEQIIAWCCQSATMKQQPQKFELEQAYAGCIIFDEAHKAKNLSDNTKTAQLVLQLQRRLPKARIVYVSATGVSDLAQLAYAERLGLWGATTTPGSNGSSDEAEASSSSLSNTSTTNASSSSSSSSSSPQYFVNFAAFRNSLEKRGLASLELLALELKLQGSFLARTLSWDGAEFQTTQIPLSVEQEQVYDQSVHWWNQCKTSLEQALTVLKEHGGGSPTGPGLVWRTFWSAHQRFFKELAICAKVPFLAQDALQQIQQGNCVVIGLQSTGDANLQTLLGNNNSTDGKDSKRSKASRQLLVEEPQIFPTLLSTVAAVLTNFVANHFPTTPPPPEVPKLPPTPTSVEERERYALVKAQIDRIQALPPPEPLPELVAIQQSLLHATKVLDLPPNPLDDLIDRLGGVDQVAEMTGRPGRMVRVQTQSKSKTKNNKKESFVYSKRVAASQDDSDRVNLVERRHFQDGTKAVAIISDAASTGISLHAARGSKASHKRRIHYTLELPWSADKAVQQLGRSHRSGQESAPIYQLVVTNLGGERRFAAAVSKRMASLGALTKGDRRAATGSDMLSEFDLDSRYGKRALKRFYSALEEHQLEELVREQQQSLASDNSNAVQAAVLSAFPSRKSREILDQFVDQMIEAKDPIVELWATDIDKDRKHSMLLAMAAKELDQLGLDQEARGKADVRVFLNRLAGLTVSRQTLVFSLFMSTLEDVIKEAKSTGEYEGTAEDIRATTLEIGSEDDLTADPVSGVMTKLTRLVLDRGISFEMICNMAQEEARKSPDAPLANANAKSPHDDDDENDDDDDDDDDLMDDDDGWMSKSTRMVAKPGFYISRNRIAGRHLILFARRKFDQASFQTEEEASNFDPLGLMVITRPNTGTNLSDFTTGDLHTKYQLALGCSELKQNLQAANEDGSAVDLVRQASTKVASLWGRAYEESDFDIHQNGLAPRRDEVVLVTGPVLHVLPLLEKAVAHRTEKERALKIMRAQIHGRRIVGVRFPSSDDALQKLQAELAKVHKDRNNAGNAFTEEALFPICSKSLQWATTERKTMKSFFKVAAKPTTNGTNAGTSTASQSASGASSKGKPKTTTKRSAPASTSVVSSKKSKSITSFFSATPKN